MYRLRLLNGSNARTYRLNLVTIDLETQTISQHNSRILVIGTEGGLLWKSQRLGDTDSLTLAPAERLDILLELTRIGDGKQLYFINSAEAPFIGSTSPQDSAEL